MRAYERFIKYAAVGTASDESSTRVPSTERQFRLAHMLAGELHELGVDSAYVDDKCYVYAVIPASADCLSKPRLGFIAHLDTSPDFCGDGVSPRIIEGYNGGDIRLESGRIIRVSDFPHLPSLAGRTLIVTDGTTLLGADDKAGVAEIMTFVEKLLRGGDPHGQISICFTPDEEIGRGADHFDLGAFAADFAYTVDGGEEGEVVFENFNAAAAKFTVTGFNIHPGEAKDKMINAQLVAMELNAMLPAGQTPRDTEGYEGFYHICNITGSVERAELSYIVRDHDAAGFNERLDTLRKIEYTLNQKYGDGTVSLEVREQYRNMSEKILPCYHLVENAVAATEAAGIRAVIRPIRGGTDGARLSFMGLPCPNLGTGGHAFHGPYEHISAEGMDSVVEILLGIVRRYSVTHT